jgi:succinoglycan biosynthesis protein ExoO
LGGRPSEAFASFAALRPATPQPAQADDLHGLAMRRHEYLIFGQPLIEEAEIEKVTKHPKAPLPTVTVLIAAYNAKAFLQRAVLSALTQSISVLEVLIVDDASNDGTLTLIEQLAMTDSRVRFLAMPHNGGPSMARNAGLDAAKGQWVAILDADDAYLPERLEQMLKTAVEMGADIVVDNFRYYDAAKGTIGPPVLDEQNESVTIDFQHFLAKAKPFTGEADWGLLKPMFRKAFLDKTGLRYPIYSRHGEDFLLLVEAFLAGARYVLMPQAGYLYTDRSSGLSRTLIDYALMLQHTEALMNDPRVARDAKLIEGVRQRVHALKRQAAERELARCRQEGDYKSVIRHVVFDSAFRAMLAGKGKRKLTNMG